MASSKPKVPNPPNPNNSATPSLSGTPAPGTSPSPEVQPGQEEKPKPNIKTMAVQEYLGMIDKLLQQGLETLVIERPENPVEFMSHFLKDNDPNKKPPQYYTAGPPPHRSSCKCRVGPPLPPTSCGCFHEPGWEPNPEFPPVGWPDLTSIEYVEAIDTIALP